IVTWLKMPASKRPLLIMSYFEQPDAIVHFKNDEEVSKELEMVESILDYLFKTLHSMKLLNCINIIVLSDHGMQKIDRRIYLDKMINNENILFADGVVGQIYFTNETNFTLQNKIKKTMEELKCRNNEYYRIYDKRQLPKRYHFSKSNRIGDIILDGQLGTIFHENYAADYHKTHDHGYDFLEEPMHAIFYAYGPNIARGLVLKPFQNIELFNLMIGLNEKPCLYGLSSLISGSNEMCYLSNCFNNSQSAVIQRSNSIFPIALIERINSNFSSLRSQQKNESVKWITTSLSIKGTYDLNVNLYSDFVSGYFATLEKIAVDYAKFYNEVVIISGPIYDFDDDEFSTDSSRITFESNLQRNTTPSHIFRVIFRCKNSNWLNSELRCENAKSLDALAFILPNVPVDYNCLNASSYLNANKARLRDIELLTGLEFLPTSSISETELYDDEFSITLRTMISEYLWLEKEFQR
ncbi:unnamed protein product, partial [Cercopithifilaria johnstoni]